MRKISYNKRRSKFYDALESQLDLSALLVGELLKVKFNDRGYALRESVIVIEDNWFLCEFSGSDITRFPSRIKALASYLNSLELHGEFVVSHEDGLCTVQLLKAHESNLDVAAQASVTESTERIALASSRIGQGRYRKDLFKISSSCPITGTTDPRFLIASHIKPWRVSTNQERLDPENGFLLAPHIDTLFDKGYISVSDNGELMVSSTEIEAQLEHWRVDLKVKISGLSARKKTYLAYHREVVFIQ
ncbi:HNH endonuclease signature motif containing protein [Amphritea sp. 2_MG-2023]|uniref:HNH endonuclease n=1 Tax=Amphritea TaxID=515417 RepID=UPI001C06955A|nr:MULTISPECIES: HNH endonuclease signature motif containing protein [Amphritea]MBU2966926.1 HNH endonuclease [Amphritea atlantica]MDO6420740.1 HNH endonuclease signature motif containing protein [Amphritea sp. 2_MG-2023]